MTPRSHELTLRLPTGHWQALQRHCATSGDSPAHVLRVALADYLDLEHHTLWQVSTSTAVVEGVFGGCLRVGDLRRHGDFGLGTFDGLDGEGILLDGECWQARADGSLSRAPDEELTPFWIATHFQTDERHTFTEVADLKDLAARLDRLRPSPNLFVAIRIRGRFSRIHVRSVGRVEEGTDLVSAAGHQAVFEHQDLAGTLVGFWSPTYARSLSIPGYHFHLLSDDRRHGGHLLDLAARELLVELHLKSDLRLALPQTRAFLEADLGGDPSAALALAETNQGPAGPQT